MLSTAGEIPPGRLLLAAGRAARGVRGDSTGVLEDFLARKGAQRGLDLLFQDAQALKHLYVAP
jgi:hypothetical protein